LTTGDDAANTFLAHLTAELLRCWQRNESGNVDRERFSEPSPLTTRVRSKVRTLASFFGFYRPSAIPQDELRSMFNIEGLDHAYGLLQDERSRDLFVKVLAYRVLGNRHVRLPLNNAEYWKLRRSLDKYVERRDTAKSPILGSLHLCNFNKMRLHVHPLAILHTFLLEQYRCERAGIGVKAGDVVIDAGGCWGDTALYFARSAAQVFCFECIPSNLKIIGENLTLNPSLSRKIRVVQKALWNKSGEKLVFQEMGPGSRASSDGTGVDVETQSLDEFVAANAVQRVDFIKMDIEGAEKRALMGAGETIRKYRPQLAISIYHDMDHFASIPRWIADLNLGYRFYLDHFTIHAEETVLFARTDS
jgi:FkbM family methyltransferase